MSRMTKVSRHCPCLQPEEDDITELDYCHCGLNDVPNEVFMYERTLEELHLDSNQIRDLPRPLFHCHGLRKLGLSDNEIQSLPPAVASLINLEHLDISKNGIIAFPDNIKGCKNLFIVEASINPLGKLPDGFTQLINLGELYLNDTFLDFLPANFGRLSKLKILELRENRLKALPKSMARLTELIRLDIGQNEFYEIPEAIGSLGKLEELWCDSNEISHLPHFLKNLKFLKCLDASGNNIEWFSPELCDCINLEDLRISNNCLRELPDGLGNFKKLITFQVDNNYLGALPNTIGSLYNLEELVVSQNDLCTLPSTVGFLRKLHTLYIDENCLLDLPAELGSCCKLAILSARDNQLACIPDELGHLSHLCMMNLSNNQIQHLPFSITKLRELQALWLSDNQNKPLIPLQSDFDPKTGQRVLTCFILPQQKSKSKEEENNDIDSFHLSLWEEERERKQQIKFAFEEELDQPGKLIRAPTPYPKELKAHARHAKNQALKMKIGDRPDEPGLSFSLQERKLNKMPLRSLVAQEAKVYVKEAKVTKPISPNLHSKDTTDKAFLKIDKAYSSAAFLKQGETDNNSENERLNFDELQSSTGNSKTNNSFLRHYDNDFGQHSLNGSQTRDFEASSISDNETYTNIRNPYIIQKRQYGVEVVTDPSSFFSPSFTAAKCNQTSGNSGDFQTTGQNYNFENDLLHKETLSSGINQHCITSSRDGSPSVARPVSSLPHSSPYIERKNSCEENNCRRDSRSSLMDLRPRQLSSLPNAAHPNLIGIVQRSSPPPSPTHVKTLELVQKMRSSTPPGGPIANRMPSPPPSPHFQGSLGSNSSAQQFFTTGIPTKLRHSSASPPRIVDHNGKINNSLSASELMATPLSYTPRSAPSSPSQNMKHQIHVSPRNVQLTPTINKRPTFLSLASSSEKGKSTINKLSPSPTRSLKSSKENIVPFSSSASQRHNGLANFPSSPTMRQTSEPDHSDCNLIMNVHASNAFVRKDPMSPANSNLLGNVQSALPLGTPPIKRIMQVSPVTKKPPAYHIAAVYSRFPGVADIPKSTVNSDMQASPVNSDTMVSSVLTSQMADNYTYAPMLPQSDSETLLQSGMYSRPSGWNMQNRQAMPLAQSHNAEQFIGDKSNGVCSRPSSTGSNPTVSKSSYPANFTQDKPSRTDGLPLVVPTPQRPLGNSSWNPGSRKGSWLFGPHRNPQVFPVIILRNPGLGFTVVAGTEGTPNSFKSQESAIFVVSVQPNGPASTALKPGDKILEVNGIDFNRISHEKALAILKNCGPTVSMMVSRE